VKPVAVYKTFRSQNPTRQSLDEQGSGRNLTQTE
jgi:hypothetical protein